MYYSFDPRRHGGACAVSRWSRGSRGICGNDAPNLELCSIVYGQRSPDTHPRGAYFVPSGQSVRRFALSSKSGGGDLEGRPVRVSTGESSRSWTSSVVAGGPAGEETLQKSSELLRDRPRVGEMHGADPIEASFPHVGRASCCTLTFGCRCGTRQRHVARWSLDVIVKRRLRRLSK
jgi:hypothetical protein